MLRKLAKRVCSVSAAYQVPLADSREPNSSVQGEETNRHRSVTENKDSVRRRGEAYT